MEKTVQFSEISSYKSYSYGLVLHPYTNVLPMEYGCLSRIKRDVSTVAKWSFYLPRSQVVDLTNVP